MVCECFLSCFLLRKKDVSFVNVAELFDFVIGRNLKIWLLK